MSEIQKLIITLRSKPRYVRLLEILVINGLLDIFEEELKDGKIDYLPLVINLLDFLSKNKKHYSNFNSNISENIIILSIDEILNKKFKIELDEEKLKMVLQLLKNSYLFKTIYIYIKDALINISSNFKCRSCYNVDEVNTELDKSKYPTVLGPNNI